MAKEPLLTPEQTEIVRKVVERLRPRFKTQTEFGERVDLSQQTISKILKGIPVGVFAAKKIAQSTGELDLAALLGMPASAGAVGGSIASVSEPSRPPDTLEMARKATKMLVELDGVPQAKAWALMLEIKLYGGDAADLYAEARRRTQEKASPGSTEAEYDSSSLVDEPPGPKRRKR